MREHLFKGFHPDKNGTTEITLNGEKIKGEWVEGLPFGRISGGLTPHGINSLRADKDRKVYSVFSETVCEYAGLTDKNGKMIFENDIVKVKFWSDWGECYEVSNGTVKWENGKYIIYISHYCMRLDLSNHPEMEVVGNIFESQ